MTCAHCKKAATQVCGGCKDAPVIEGDVEKPHYCGTSCQRTNWATHKKLCQRLQDRKTLYRVASTAQMIFYLYRELTWGQFDIKRVELAGDILRLLGSVNRAATWPRDYKTFPAHLVQTKEDKEAMLSNKACKDAAEIMMEFVGSMLNGIVTNTQDIHFHPKGHKRQTTLLPNIDFSRLNIPIFDMREGDHEVLKLTLRSGELFAIDLSGAQYGHHEPVTPWHLYEATRVRQVISSGRLSGPRGTLSVNDYSLEGQFREASKRFSATSDSGGPIWVDILNAVNAYILGWQYDENLALKAMWKLPEDEFKQKQKSLVDEIESELRKPLVNGKWPSQR